MKLIQKHLLKGTQTFEIIGDTVEVESKRWKTGEQLTVMLSVLNPEPVITQSTLDFVSRVNGEALLSLWLGKPNQREFNAFVSRLRQLAEAEYNTFSGLKSTSPAEGQARAEDIEPPEFGEDETRIRQAVNVEELGNTIRMLETHVGGEGIVPLVDALRALQEAPEDGQCLTRVVTAFNELGPLQGAVLTYAPYLISLMSDDPYAGF
ncbi:MAG: hypothetical protein ACPGU7_13490 [Gammaproteobacteria bacterium]